MGTRTMSSRSATANDSPLPTIGRQGPTPKKTANVQAKNKGKPNASILTFFKKAEDIENELFVQAKLVPAAKAEPHAPEAGLYVGWEDGQDDGMVKQEEASRDEERYQESGRPIKRRKTSTPTPVTSVSKVAPNIEDNLLPVKIKREQSIGSSNTYSRKGISSGPFMEESDSENETVFTRKMPPEKRESNKSPVGTSSITESNSRRKSEDNTSQPPIRPPLVHDETSMISGGDFDGFENIEDFEDDVYEEGDEYAERKWMEEEQRRLDEEEETFEDDGNTMDELEQKQSESSGPTNAPSCPICSITMDGISDQDAAVHVNNCLDGKPTPLPVKKESSSTSSLLRKEGPNPAKRFKRPAKPGQENPLALGGSSSNGGSAFSKLMSGHAEDAAWATAAAAENAARGKPAYQRTCPFYKIMPGFSIAVDAFRYGAVEGQKAYFLSHFHSDHYIGLTASWSHGPIYCSKVTANLVKQQLRVDPKWVVALEFEKKVEVPGTGVDVTMIPANHCPGSSLYLFEKVVGKGKNPKVQRVLHCGDFRACRAHVEHPLLRPDVLDTVSGKERQQKLDACYLDTTYLNPKYAFPSQEDVIKACADMCVSLSKVQADEHDGWEQMKRERAGAGMVKFVRKESDSTIKKEEEDEDDVDAMKVVTKSSGKQRGRLLVIVGTYSIGKERICMGIARALKSKIYAPAGKLRICAALEDPELSALLTKDPREAQVHMTPLFEIRAETLDDYLKDYKDHFTRAVGFRPSGWNYRPPNSRFVESPSVQTVLHSENWKSTFSMKELVPQRGSTSRASCFGVPYSEHSSFRELTMFCTALRIDKIIPTVNVGSAKSREKMKGWCEKWANEKKKNGLFKLDDAIKW